MSTLAPASGERGRTGLPITSRRCARHAGREAAARCPTCGKFYCRECVVEHEGRLLCTSCLSAQIADAGAKPAQWPAARRGAGLFAALLTAGLVFYTLGSILLNVPPKYHEGTIWAPPGTP